MPSLVRKELVQQRTQILQMLGMLAAAAVLLGTRASAYASSIMFSLPAVLSMTMPQMMFDQEERGNTFVFLRALPIRPGEIVGAKYVASTVIVLAAVAIVGLGQVFSGMGRDQIMMTAAGLTLVCLLLSAISLLCHFWLGTKMAKIALIAFAFGLSAIPFLLTQSVKGFSEKLVADAEAVAALASSPAGLALAFFGGMTAMGLSLLASVSIFSSRDLSRLP